MTEPQRETQYSWGNTVHFSAAKLASRPWGHRSHSVLLGKEGSKFPPTGHQQVRQNLEAHPKCQRYYSHMPPCCCLQQQHSALHCLATLTPIHPILFQRLSPQHFAAALGSSPSLLVIKNKQKKAFSHILWGNIWDEIQKDLHQMRRWLGFFHHLGLYFFALMLSVRLSAVTLLRWILGLD